MQQILIIVFIFFSLWASNLNAQQRYEGISVFDCKIQGDKDLTSAFLYICNDTNPSCKAFLIIKSQPPYNTVPTISSLMSSDPAELAIINNVTTSKIFATGQEVIVPVSCSCSGQYYQANSSYVTKTDKETHYTIAKGTYQGLSSCSSLVAENSFSLSNLWSGLELRVPLRCACPSSDQIANGIKYMLTYSISFEDSVYIISKRFNVSLSNTFDANGFSEPNPTIYPFTTILIPFASEPSSSQTVVHYPLSPVSPPPISNPKKKTSKKGLHIKVGVAASGLLIFLCLFSALIIAFFRHNKKNKIEGQENFGEIKKWVLPEGFLKGIAGVDRVLKAYAYEELQAATRNFSYECKIGGSVYRGEVSGRTLAIKKTGTDVSKEINILNKINHFNLIRLYGVCVGQENCYLVYEYMENGSLRDWLSDRSYSSVRSWKQRIQIALDIANGLHYLHNFTEPAHVHKDIKTSNVLLNGDLRAKIANFGHARSADGQEGGFILTKHIEGTKGYMAREYLENGLVTSKLDIYAFGVVMLELITGKDAIIKDDEGEVLLSMAMISIVEGGNIECKLSDFMDPTLNGAYHMDLAKGVAKLSVACLRRDSASRPSMDEVVSTLSRILMDSMKWES